ncbi:Pup--protein ligase [Corynebacterium sp. 320]|nr:Pup--protein ligase [Corynebacterium sp. 320]KAB1553440.1 Pup--protein ligase [Corynebacterium sp. 321]KAB1554452.1 Pup--protein ligase [Corynebacterium sp. 319]KAB3528637.1 Pup--protein ligase [Corynebacterium sp. 250]KAB3540927.1 Pup--protein ligase [Corynebacterium sp. 366]QNP93199.1 Pup--protein ligase [Corynebacterium zhongnanshanii]
MGVETEYGITNVLNSSRRLGPDEISRQLFAPIVEQHRSSNIYADNASRLYLDVGSHPEVATAECDSLHQLIAHDRAGDMMVHDLAVRAEEALAAKGVGGSVYLLKNNTDSLGNSYGCHENYLVGRDVSLKGLSRQLLPFLVTRQLLCGAGKLVTPSMGTPNDQVEAGFSMSQRADHMWEGVSSATTRSRPIINTRDEPHADSSRYRRLHVIVGDSNMSEVTTALKIGSTLLVLEMIEAGVALPNFEMANEIRSIRDVSRDFTGTVELNLRGGGVATPLEIQRAFLDAALCWLKDRPEPEQDEHGRWLGTPAAQLLPVVDLWGRVLDCFDSGDFSPVATEVDWVIKKTLMDRMAERNNLDACDPRLAQVDLTYHDIHPDRGLFHVLAKRGFAKTLLTQEEIRHAQAHAPETTRAALRGAFLRAARDNNVSITVDWTRLKINGEGGWETMLGDPFAHINSDVDEMVLSMCSFGAQDSHCKDCGLDFEDKISGILNGGGNKVCLRTPTHLDLS